MGLDELLDIASHCGIIMSSVVGRVAMISQILWLYPPSSVTIVHVQNPLAVPTKAYTSLLRSRERTLLISIQVHSKNWLIDILADTTIVLS